LQLLRHGVLASRKHDVLQEAVTVPPTVRLCVSALLTPADIDVAVTAVNRAVAEVLSDATASDDEHAAAGAAAGAASGASAADASPYPVLCETVVVP
jgi:hypothetical protein